MDIDKRAVDDWLDTYWAGSRICPICGSEDWITFEKAWECREFNRGNLVAGGPVLPLVAMMCNVCGHVLLFNAIAVRAIQPTAE
jgi:rubredoxin